MADIDSELSLNDVKFHQRPLKCFSQLCKKISNKGSFPLSKVEPFNCYDFSNSNIYSQVCNWYKLRYGDRLKVAPGPGSYVLLIRNEAWRINFPLFFGTVNFGIDSGINDNQPFSSNIKNVSVFQYIEGLTKGIIDSLTVIEKTKILDEFMFSFDVIQHLHGQQSNPYIMQAINDYNMAINNIFDRDPNYNNIKWNALQFSEKILKSQINEKSIKIPRTHKLHELVKLLDDLDLPENIITTIQCEPGVRYRESEVTRIEAITAIQNAIYLCSCVLKPSSFSIIRS